MFLVLGLHRIIINKLILSLNKNKKEVIVGFYYNFFGKDKVKGNKIQFFY